MAAVLVGLHEPLVSLGKRRAPAYPLPEQAMRALGHASGYAAWRQRPLGQPPNRSNVDTRRPRAALGPGPARGSTASGARCKRSSRRPVPLSCLA